MEHLHLHPQPNNGIYPEGYWAVDEGNYACLAAHCPPAVRTTRMEAPTEGFGVSSGCEAFAACLIA